MFRQFLCWLYPENPVTGKDCTRRKKTNYRLPKRRKANFADFGIGLFTAGTRLHRVTLAVLDKTKARPEPFCVNGCFDRGMSV